jgi:hypothetical protein
MKDAFKEFRITGTRKNNSHDTRSLYVVAVDEEEALKLISGHGYTEGYHDFKVDRDPKPAAEGPARVIGMWFDISSRP